MDELIGSKSAPRERLSEQEAEIKKLKTELRRVTEERNILKEAAVYFAESKRKVHVHKISA